MTTSRNRDSHRRARGLLAGAGALSLIATLATTSPALAVAPPSTATLSAATLPASTTMSAAPLLRLGSRGDAVRAWQHNLNGLEAGSVSVDGVFGPRTRAATIRFQRAFGLAQDGVVGPNSRAKMAQFLAFDGVVTDPLPASSPVLLRLGSRGQAVREWQGRLTEALDRTLAIDGSFGPATKAATVAFQRSHGLVPDGVAGPKSRAAMRAALS